MSSLNITRLDNGIRFGIKVIPGSSRSEIVEVLDNNLKIKLNSPPVDGKANKECIKYLSKLIKVPKTSIEIVHGEKSKLKTIFINGDCQELENKLVELVKTLGL